MTDDNDFGSSDIRRRRSPITGTGNHVGRVLVCGGRNYSDYARFCEVIGALNPRVLIHGGATGADAMADRWAAERPEVGVLSVPAEWRRLGFRAGPIRNQRMLDECRPHLVVAFPGGRGTANMVRLARAAHVTVLQVDAAPQPVIGPAIRRGSDEKKESHNLRPLTEQE